MRYLLLFSFVIALSVSQTIACTSDKVYVKFTKKSGDKAASEEQFIVLDGVNKLYTSPIMADGQTRELEVCLPSTTNNQYTLRLVDTYGDSWAAGAWLMAQGFYGNRIFKVFMVESSEETYPLSLYYGVVRYDSWKLTSSSVTGSWTEYNYDDALWSQVSMGAVTVPVSGTQYLRKQFTGLAGMASYEVSFYYRLGIVAYINGVEIYRDNMPDGVPTSTTLATGDYPAIGFHAVIRSASEVASAQTVLAVEIHFMTAEGQAIVDFDAYLAINAASTVNDSCFVYPYDTAVTENTANDFGKAFDFDKQSVARKRSNAVPFTVSYVMNGPKVLINGVRVWPHGAPVDAVGTYNFQGAYDISSTWTTAVSASNVVYETNTYVISKGYFNTALYNHYRIQALGSSGTSVSFYEVQPLVCNSVTPTTIEFTPALATGYTHYEDMLVRPVVSEFTNCTITPAVPAGLAFDYTTCTLTGRGQVAGTTTFTVTSTGYGLSMTGTFTLQLTECSGSLVTLRRVYTSNAAYEAYTLKDSTQTVIAEVNQNSGQMPDSTVNTVLCLTSNKYTIVLTCGLTYWQPTSFLYIDSPLDGLNDYETLLKVRYDSNSGIATTYTFNAQYTIKSTESWNYKMGEVPANWYSNDMSGWATATANNFPASSNQIQLYKKSFTVSSLENVAGMFISLKYQYGVIIYLNNHEVFRKGFSGNLSTSTYSTTSLSNANFRTISLPIKSIGDGTNASVDYLTTGTNTIAIGMVAAGVAQTAATFNAALRLAGDISVSRIQDMSYAAAYISGDLTNLSAKYYAYSIYQSNCNDNYINLTFPDDRHEWISSVIIKLPQTQNNQQPRQFIVKAKNAEDSTWTTLKTVTGLTWSLAGQSQRIWLTNSKSYNQYRLENIKTGISGSCPWKLNYIDLNMDATQIEVPALSYPVTSVFKDIEMGEVYPNSDYYTDFSVNPPLPEGITINPQTGIISGTAHAVVASTVYTISAKKFNTGEAVTAQLSFSVEICTGGRSLITLVARADDIPDQCSYKVYQGKDTSTVIHQVEKLVLPSALHYGDFCLPHGIYTLEVKDTSNGWNIPAGYYLTVDIGEMKFEMGQVYSTTAPAVMTKYFSSYLPFQIEYDDWKIFKGTDVAENWKAIDFDDSTWTVTKAADIGTNEAITTYIRREVTLDDIANYHVLNIRVRYTGGVVAYFNGRRVARFNLIDDFEFNTESMSVHDSNTFSKFHIVLNTVGAVTGKNIMAFEIHRPLGQSSAEPVVFDATGVFGVNDCSIGVDSYSEITGSSVYTIGKIENFFDLTPATYGYQQNALSTYIQWTVENLEGTRFNSFALETTYARSSWGFSVYGREQAFEDDDPNAEEYTSMFAEVNLTTKERSRVAWDVPVGIAGFRQFKHEVDDTANNTVYISAYILQYCKASGTGSCPGVDDYPPVGEGQISPSECEAGYRGYSYRMCSGGVLGSIQTDKCVYKLPLRLRYSSDRYILVLNTESYIEPPSYVNHITNFSLEENTHLPEGLELDPTTGAITGTATKETDVVVYTIYGSNPAGTTSTTIQIGTRKGECRAEGNFPKTYVGEVAEYECSVAGAYVGTQKRACVLGARDGEWQKIKGVCMPIIVVVLIVIVVIIIIVVIVMIIVRNSKKRKAVGGVKGGKKPSKSASKKTLDKKSSVKV